MTQLDDGNNEFYKRRLERMGITYRTILHDPVTTMEHSLEFNCLIAKNMLVHNKKNNTYFLLMTTPTTRIDFKKLAQILQTSRSSLNFATSDELTEVLHTTSGLVSPLALPERHVANLRFLIDTQLCGKPALGFHAGKNTETLAVSFTDLEKFCRQLGYTITPIQI
ncbi:YbaK/EbsC family protein [Bifidobacterium sp. ESL0732]|uniref:YbaK/EbsC family protein n=1 Tax=Bifidobacterium sp. ESL0732 TaxID=2983222 RepID=UPI0023F859F8|nr:YbaK/EbsC family protein [Bifidobacterium sp. ESL0732]WEV63794.1 hypothetical protein OZX70_07625 [Bifidobacterium sp. ESL0732]